MEEKEKSEKKCKVCDLFSQKNFVMPAGVGLIIGIVLTCIVWYFVIYSGSSNVVATLKGAKIEKNVIYDKLKLINGLNVLISEVDETIIRDMYELTEKEEAEIEKTAQNYIDTYAMYYGYTEEEFLKTNGCATYEEFLDDLRASKKMDKYWYEYLESQLEEGAVQNYYNDNKEDLETYDSEHILVEISDEVPEQEALALANEILAKVNEGKTFEDIEEEYGDKIVHEELGYYGKDSNLEQTYIDELVALEDGAYSSAPIKTSYGYHIVHKIATSTLDELRETIIDLLSEDLLADDAYLKYKTFIELRKENNFKINDEELNKQYEEYCNYVYEG